MNSEGIFKCAFGSCKYHTYIINDIHVKIKYINDNNRMLFEYLYNMIEDNNLKIMDMLILTMFVILYNYYMIKYYVTNNVSDDVL
jgi:hypothetical protein